ncbi:uncharacterized protein LOC123507023 [Portunus trituberculatus]|uniref:uncharacterized protein LOC123507023 n=1 Tax=Portunus trituberculatus TaxID=210409 RepID=UPI001E1D0B70|nr:uncharacterized protein LOC123507023 [Portunus trituberculatus]
MSSTGTIYRLDPRHLAPASRIPSAGPYTLTRLLPLALQSLHEPRNTNSQAAAPPRLGKSLEEGGGQKGIPKPLSWINFSDTLHKVPPMSQTSPDSPSPTLALSYAPTHTASFMSHASSSAGGKGGRKQTVWRVHTAFLKEYLAYRSLLATSRHSHTFTAKHQYPHNPYRFPCSPIHTLYSSHAFYHATHTTTPPHTPSSHTTLLPILHPRHTSHIAHYHTFTTSYHTTPRYTYLSQTTPQHHTPEHLTSSPHPQTLHVAHYHTYTTPHHYTFFTTPPPHHHTTIYTQQATPLFCPPHILPQALTSPPAASLYPITVIRNFP